MIKVIGIIDVICGFGMMALFISMAFFPDWETTFATSTFGLALIGGFLALSWRLDQGKTR